MNLGFIEDTHFHGGTQIWVTEAIRTFLDHGEDVTLLAPRDSWIVNACADYGVSIFTYDWDEVIHERDEHIQRWTEALRQCDVAVCTVHPPRDDFHCAVFAARCINMADLNTHLIPKTGTIVPSYERQFYRPDETINSSVIAIADFTRQYLIEKYGIPGEIVKLIYQGVDTQRFLSSPEGMKQARNRYPLPDNATPILGTVGSFEHRKGLPVLFKAVAKLVAGPLPETHLMLVGDGPDESYLRDLSDKLKLTKHISFFPFTSEPNYIFERIDITALPSLYKEGLPNVLQESMAMNVPVVSSKLGGVPEVVFDGETGYMVEPGDSDQLANAIIKLWADKAAYQKMRAQVRNVITEQFDKQNQFVRFLSHFRSLC